MTMTINAFENRFLKGARLLLGGVLLVALLAGTACSTDNTEEQEAAEYPNVNKLPEAPETVATLAEAEKIEEGLRADRDNARYTDETLRADTSLQPPLPAPPKPVAEEVTEVKTETVTEVTETATAEGSETVTETVTEVVEEKTAEVEAPVVATVAQEEVTETPLPAPSVAEAAPDTTPAPAPLREQVISGEAAQKPAIESVFEQQLAASGATRLPDTMSSGGSSSSATDTAAPSPSSSSSASASSNGSVTLTPPSDDGGRVIPNYAASDGSSPIETIYFAQGSHRINAADKAKLDRIARTQMAAGGTLKIVGHASSRTRQMAEEKHMIVNLNASQARASTIAEYFIKAGVEPSNLLVESVSDTKPMITEPMPSAEAKNRRAEIFLLN